MSDRVTRHFGYGPLGIPVSVSPTRRRVEPRSLREGIGHWHREGAPARTARDLARGLSPPLLAALGMWMLLSVVDRPDESAIAIVPFEPAPPVQVARVEPPPVPVLPEPEPPPEPLRPEPPPPVPEPVLPKPAPPPPVARPEPPPPAPAPPPVRRQPPRPEPAPRQPAPQIDRMLARAEPAPPPPEPERRAPTPRRAPPSVAPPPPVQLDRVAARQEPAPELPTRARPRFDVARSSRSATDLAPAALPAAPDPARARDVLPGRVGRSAPARRERPDAPAPEPLAPPPTAPRTATRRPTRAARASAPPRPERQSAPRDVQLAAAAPAPAPVRAPEPRSARAEPRPAPQHSRQDEPGAEIPGIDLGSLAPCLTDAREHALKQEVVARAGNRASCRSPAGRFHFVETKNVNAFLMGIEVAPGRATTDRCGELAFALDCLDAASRRSGR